MGRPSVLSRGLVAGAALRVLDNEGLEAVSVERIARELGVRGPSIYHHFSNKYEILTEVANMVLGDLGVRREAADWQAWMIGVCLTFHRHVLDHPSSAVVLLQHLPELATLPALNAGSRYLARNGLDPALQLLVLESTEKLTWGWSLHRAMEMAAGVAPPGDDEERLETALRALMEGVLSRHEDRRHDPTDGH